MPGFQADVMGSGIAAQAAAAINGSGTPNVTATGSGQSDAYALITSTTEFTTVASGTGARLPGTSGRVVGGDVLVVVNQGANTLAVYPPTGFKIGLAATNAAVNVASGKVGLFLARGDGNYFQLVGA